MSDSSETFQMRRPEDFERKTARINGIDINYVVEGSGEPLLLLHGWPGEWWEYWRNIGPLAKKFKVIVPDLRGFGDSEKVDVTDQTNYELRHVIDDLAGLLDHLGVDKAYLAGHDWGGMILHKFVRRHPERSRKLLIVNPFLPGCEVDYLSPEHFHVSWYSQFNSIPEMAELIGYNRDTIRMYFDYIYRRCNPQHPDWLPKEELEIFVDTLMKPDAIQGGFNLYRAAFQPGSPEFWTRLDRTPSSIPLRVLWGMQDPFVPAEWSGHVAKWYTNYTMLPVHEAGHYVNMEAPDVYNREVEAFFRD